MTKVIFTNLLIFACFLLSAQTNENLIRCYTVENQELRSQSIPGIPDMDAFEEWLAPKIKDYKNRPATEKTILTIPCVVHVIHNGEDEGTAPNITDEQAISQINVLNEDFSRTNPDAGDTRAEFLSIAADVEIRFVMAQTDPNGNLTNGVNHVNFASDGVTRDQIEGMVKPNTQWDPTQYLNMWSVKFAAPDDNLLGYAQFPEGSGLAGMPTGTETANTDGIVIRFNSFGTVNHANGANFLLDAPYDLGRTGTHEVGHWVGLRHTWGDGLGCSMGAPTAGCSCTQDDFCGDTPNSDQANYGCALTKTSNCDDPTVNYTDQIENYMDYTNDACMNMFTADQKARVQAVMANSPRRMELPNSLAAFPPAPYVLFNEEESSVVENSSCNFRDITVGMKIAAEPSGDVTATITAGGDATSGTWKDYELLNNTVVFTPSELRGTVTIRIYEDDIEEADENITLNISTVSGADGQVGFTKQSHKVIIQDDDDTPELKGRTPGTVVFMEDFELSSTTASQWVQPNQYGSAEWNIGASGTGLPGNSAFIGTMGAYTYAPYNTETRARFDSPVINTINVDNLSVTFDYICQGEVDGSSIFDFGALFYSVGGQKWTPFGPVLVSQTTATTITVNLPVEAANQANLHIGFQWFNDSLLGNEFPFTIDNIVVQGSIASPTAVSTVAGKNVDVYLSPNSSVCFYDEDGAVIAVVDELSGYDYGCTTIEVATDGTSAFNLSGDTEETKKIGSKTWTVTPTTNHTDGSYRITYFVNNAERTGWESGDRQASDLILAKIGGVAANATSIDDFTPGVSNIFEAYNTTDSKISGVFNTGFSGFVFVDSDAFAVLPLEWLSFTGGMKGGEVELSWATGFERNTDYFVIEHSTDGRNFEALGSTAAAGNSESREDYNWTHDRPTKGINYYRIQQFDLNGESNYSRVISLKTDATNLISTLYPNPTSDAINVTFTTENVQSISIYNSLGQVVKSLNVNGLDAENISVKELGTGIYFLEVKSGNVREMQRFVID